MGAATEVVEAMHRAGPGGTKEIIAVVGKLPMLVPFLQPECLAITVSVKARVLKMATLYDLPLTLKVIDAELFGPIRSAEACHDDLQRGLDELRTKIHQELSKNVAEEGAEFAGQTQTPMSFSGQTPTGFGC